MKSSENPIVSVIIPTHNAENYILETVNSVLAQDFHNLEILIIDDCSTDNTRSKLDAIISNTVKVILLAQNHGGPSKPRNVGIKAARGKYIAFCDSDDLYCPGRLKKSIDILESNPNLGLVFTNETKFDDDTLKDIGKFLDGYKAFWSIPKITIGPNSYYISRTDAFRTLFFENFIMPSGVTVPSSIFKAVGLFDENLKNGDDRDMWFRISKNFPIAFINHIGFKYRIRTNSITSRGPMLAIYRIAVIRKRLNDPFLSVKLISQANKLISENYRNIGYYFQRSNYMYLARKYYLQSIRAHLNFKSFKGLFISFLPKFLLSTIKRA